MTLPAYSIWMLACTSGGIVMSANESADSTAALSTAPSTNALRKRVGNELSWGSRAAGGNDEILFAVQHVGHGRSRLRSGHGHCADVSTGPFVIGAQPGAALAIRHLNRAAFARDEERLGHQRAD